LLFASNVYGRYHYISDVLTGVIIGAVMLWAAGSWQRKFDTRIKKLTCGESADGSQKTETVSDEILNQPL
jgi:membrane-associated phospholipid phosphatase